MRYASGVVWDDLESIWTAFDEETGRELVSGRDVVFDRKRGNRPATVERMSSVGDFRVRYEDDEQLTNHLARCRLDPADYGVVTRLWTADIELGRK
ncbi:hypothetical protein AB0P17_29685 [Streptomyces sp. NPDC088124]|uniref:hypothetical protein n=1 Tax=Streptomyces sp. NPDC088124 TaxID=3154654 RepID=UPI00343E2C00